MKVKTKKITTLAMLCALAYIAVTVVRIPVVVFLKYEPKDVIITVGGFLFGPLASVVVSALVSVAEMVTISETGIIGMVMNFISSVSFAATAAFVYSRRKRISGAVLGLIAGTFVMTAVMLLWNYFMTPIYMGYPRSAVAEMLVPVFLPFNLLKGGLNSAITMLLYKPLVTALRRSGLVPEGAVRGKINPGVVLVSLFVLVSMIVLMLVVKKVI